MFKQDQVVFGSAIARTHRRFSRSLSRLCNHHGRRLCFTESRSTRISQSLSLPVALSPLLCLAAKAKAYLREGALPVIRAPLLNGVRQGGEEPQDRRLRGEPAFLLKRVDVADLARGKLLEVGHLVHGAVQTVLVERVHGGVGRAVLFPQVAQLHAQLVDGHRAQRGAEKVPFPSLYCVVSFMVGQWGSEGGSEGEREGGKARGAKGNARVSEYGIRDH